MKVNLFFTYLCYICIIVYVFTESIEVFRCILITFIIAMTYESLKPIKNKEKK